MLQRATEISRAPSRRLRAAGGTLHASCRLSIDFETKVHMKSSIWRRMAHTAMRWPAARELVEAGSGDAAVSEQTRAMRSRLHGAKTSTSVCPYCAVGCSMLVRVKDNELIDIEGNPASPINQGTLCPKGANTFQYAVNPNRVTRTLYRRPYGTEWETVDLDWAMARIATLVQETRDRTFIERDDKGRPVYHTEGVGFLGGATIDNEENYLIKKFCVGAGIVCVENQARI